ncbi:MAG: PLD nuclease N-terminal domain-containing protein [Desulfovibrio sp.]|nr:PLD nuclease N-terminal domain-containing protein [Desulfovibrio sp.]
MTFAWWHAAAALVPMLPTFWSIRHIWAHEFADPQRRALWLVLVVFVPVIGGLVYIFAGRKTALRKQAPGTFPHKR